MRWERRGDGAGAGQVRKAPLGPKHSCKQRQVNGFNDCEIVRCMEKPQSVTAHWLPRGETEAFPPFITAVRAAGTAF